MRTNNLFAAAAAAAVFILDEYYTRATNTRHTHKKRRESGISAKQKVSV